MMYPRIALSLVFLIFSIMNIPKTMYSVQSHKLLHYINIVQYTQASRREAQLKVLHVPSI